MLFIEKIMSKLSFSDHSRIFKDFTYIYPVLSRRSQGISLGINLNVNNACNWRCIYCQVDGLKRGKPDNIKLDILEFELDSMLDAAINTSFLHEYAPFGLDRLNDICLSGNGESTVSKQFLDVVLIIDKLRKKYNLDNYVKSILITNGSEFERDDIQQAVALLSQNNGEVWFKVDSGSVAGISQINQVALSLSGIAKKLGISCKLCKTYIQTCMFQSHGVEPTQEFIEQYINFIKPFKGEVNGVLLYSVARNPMLPEGEHISSVSLDFLARVASKVTELGIDIKYYE